MPTNLQTIIPDTHFMTVLVRYLIFFCLHYNDEFSTGIWYWFWYISKKTGDIPESYSKKGYV